MIKNNESDIWICWVESLKVCQAFEYYLPTACSRLLRYCDQQYTENRAEGREMLSYEPALNLAKKQAKKTDNSRRTYTTISGSLEIISLVCNCFAMHFKNSYVLGLKQYRTASF